MNNNLIYAYKRKSAQKIVYIGQTTNLQIRHKQHIQYDPYNKNLPEYNYPLSRGIRKYGEQEYELIILETDIPDALLDDREIYWIAYYDTYYHGYNQTIGGKSRTHPVYDEKMIKLVISMLKNPDNTYKDICNKTGLSMTHIYNINSGNRRKQKYEKYPIRESNEKGTRGLKLTPQQNIEIHYLLLHSHKEMKEIASIYNCEVTTISRINRGLTKAYKLKEYTYPLR